MSLQWGGGCSTLGLPHPWEPVCLLGRRELALIGPLTPLAHFRGTQLLLASPLLDLPLLAVPAIPFPVFFLPLSHSACFPPSTKSSGALVCPPEGEGATEDEGWHHGGCSWEHRCLCESRAQSEHASCRSHYWGTLTQPPHFLPKIALAWLLVLIIGLCFRGVGFQSRNPWCQDLSGTFPISKALAALTLH